MSSKKNCVAMLLAGGQGSRLGVLTKERAKPAVPYGGKYKIIDFPLSNCIHSGIDTVGVLTQYQPLELNAYIGTGAPWDLDCMSGGAFVLPPYVRGKTGEWYSGTANAIYQNLYFIEQYDPKYVLILSGDHIYKMNYAKMLQFHEEKGADATIAVIEVPMEEASRFGIMNTDEDLRINEFEEKPAHPKNNMASMGVYVFSYEVMKKYLKADAENPDSDNDFGKNVIPAMLAGGEKLYAYPFKGYWKDVGTVDSLWEANMELLSNSPELELDDDAWRIYNRNPNMPPHYVAESAVVRNSLVSEGCAIYGTVENSVIFPGVQVAAGALIKDSIVMRNTQVGAGSQIIRAILDEDVKVGEDCTVGGEAAIAVLGTRVQVQKDALVEEGRMVSPGEIIE